MKKITDFFMDVFAVLAMLALVLMLGCKSSKSSYVSEQLTVSDERLAVCDEQSTGGSEQTDRMTVSEWVAQWEAFFNQKTTLDDTETIQEKIIVVTDSIGVVTRTEERTTNRSTATQAAYSASLAAQQYKPLTA